MTQIQPSITEIGRVHNPTREEFDREFVQKRKPVIITGVADQWRAMSEWTPDYLKATAGQAEVDVHFSEKGNFHRWYTEPEKRTDLKMKFGDMIDIMRGPAETANKYYMTEHNLSLISEDLLGDLTVGSLIDETVGPGKCTGPTLFLGQNTCMPSHLHGTTEAFMCQLQGTKEVILHGPEQTPKLYPLPWYSSQYLFSEVDWFTDRQWKKVDYDKYPLAKDAQALEFTVHPGEILFIPVHWWHVTSVQGYQLSITYFWMSDRSRWHFPSPGNEVQAHLALEQFKKMFAAMDQKGLFSGGGARREKRTKEAFEHFQKMCEALGCPLPEGEGTAQTLYEQMNL